MFNVTRFTGIAGNLRSLPVNKIACTNSCEFVERMFVQSFVYGNPKNNVLWIAVR
jgi:hypothetical protein